MLKMVYKYNNESSQLKSFVDDIHSIHINTEALQFLSIYLKRFSAKLLVQERWDNNSFSLCTSLKDTKNPLMLKLELDHVC